MNISGEREREIRRDGEMEREGEKGRERGEIYSNSQVW